MAVLNIKNVPDALYDRLKTRAKAQRRSVAQEVIHLLEHAVGDEELHSILALEGLGADLWAGIDATDHVAAERDAWD